MSLLDIYREARAAMDEHGLTDWRLDWDRAVRRAGACHHSRKTITLSGPIFSLPENSDRAHETALHEIAHALVGPGKGHGPEWRRQARALGIKPERYHALPTPRGKVLGHCDCVTPHTRHRMPPTHLTYRCQQCYTTVRWTR